MSSTVSSSASSSSSSASSAVSSSVSVLDGVLSFLHADFPVNCYVNSPAPLFFLHQFNFVVSTMSHADAHQLHQLLNERRRLHLVKFIRCIVRRPLQKKRSVNEEVTAVVITHDLREKLKTMFNAKKNIVKMADYHAMHPLNLTDLKERSGNVRSDLGISQLAKSLSNDVIRKTRTLQFQSAAQDKIHKHQQHIHPQANVPKKRTRDDGSHAQEQLENERPAKRTISNEDANGSSLMNVPSSSSPSSSSTSSSSSSSLELLSVSDEEDFILSGFLRYVFEYTDSFTITRSALLSILYLPFVHLYQHMTDERILTFLVHCGLIIPGDHTAKHSRSVTNGQLSSSSASSSSSTALGSDSYFYFSLPHISPFIVDVDAGRMELVTKICKSTYSEIALKELEKLPMKKTRLNPKFLLRDLLGENVLMTVTAGSKNTLIRMSDRNG